MRNDILREKQRGIKHIDYILFLSSYIGYKSLFEPIPRERLVEQITSVIQHDEALINTLTDYIEKSIHIASKIRYVPDVNYIPDVKDIISNSVLIDMPIGDINLEIERLSRLNDNDKKYLLMAVIIGRLLATMISTLFDDVQKAEQIIKSIDNNLSITDENIVEVATTITLALLLNEFNTSKNIIEYIWNNVMTNQPLWTIMQHV